ncbi:MAG: hypothetical protein KGJ62_07695 [Armatimonadetes bacterium]|nr:hypothetical protein [Armatimonadota bacterium]MDE2207239.1 hypothetical protein [Armatimonadota bacterium]
MCHQRLIVVVVHLRCAFNRSTCHHDLVEVLRALAAMEPAAVAGREWCVSNVGVRSFVGPQPAAYGSAAINTLFPELAGEGARVVTVPGSRLLERASIVQRFEEVQCARRAGPGEAGVPTDVSAGWSFPDTILPFPADMLVRCCADEPFEVVTRDRRALSALHEAFDIVRIAEF